MYKSVLVVCASLLFTSSIATAGGPSILSDKVWHHDMQKAHQVAINEGKPMLIVFGASWCKFCTKLEKNTLTNPGMAQYISQNFVPVHLDLDKEKKIGKILGVKSLPCTIVLSPEADLLGKIVGYKSVEDMQAQLQRALKTQNVLRQASQKKRNFK